MINTLNNPLKFKEKVLLQIIVEKKKQKAKRTI